MRRCGQDAWGKRRDTGRCDMRLRRWELVNMNYEEF